MISQQEADNTLKILQDSIFALLPPDGQRIVKERYDRLTYYNQDVEGLMNVFYDYATATNQHILICNLITLLHRLDTAEGPEYLYHGDINGFYNKIIRADNVEVFRHLVTLVPEKKERVINLMIRREDPEFSLKIFNYMLQQFRQFMNEQIDLMAGNMLIKSLIKYFGFRDLPDILFEIFDRMHTIQPLDVHFFRDARRPRYIKYLYEKGYTPVQLWIASSNIITEACFLISKYQYKVFYNELVDLIKIGFPIIDEMLNEVLYRLIFFTIRNIMVYGFYDEQEKKYYPSLIHILCKAKTEFGGVSEANPNLLRTNDTNTWLCILCSVDYIQKIYLKVFQCIRELLKMGANPNLPGYEFSIIKDPRYPKEITKTKLTPLQVRLATKMKLKEGLYPEDVCHLLLYFGATLKEWPAGIENELTALDNGEMSGATFKIYESLLIQRLAFLKHMSLPKDVIFSNLLTKQVDFPE